MSAAAQALAMLLPACSTQIKSDWSLSFMSASPSVADLDPAARAPRRVRHEPRRRQLDVRRVDKIAAPYDPGHARRRPRGLHQSRVRRSRQAVLSRPRRSARWRTADAGTRLHAAPLQPRRQYPGNRLRHSRRGTGDALGRKGAARRPAGDRRTAGVLHYPDQFRLASPDRRRNRDPGDWTQAG